MRPEKRPQNKVEKPVAGEGRLRDPAIDQHYGNMAAVQERDPIGPDLQLVEDDQAGIDAVDEAADDEGKIQRRVDDGDARVFPAGAFPAGQRGHREDDALPLFFAKLLNQVFKLRTSPTETAWIQTAGWKRPPVAAAACFSAAGGSFFLKCISARKARKTAGAGDTGCRG